MGKQATKRSPHFRVICVLMLQNGCTEQQCKRLVKVFPNCCAKLCGQLWHIVTHSVGLASNNLQLTLTMHGIVVDINSSHSNVNDLHAYVGIITP